ncbi:hypothetical protein B1R32_11477 [Abditibacterium utsteinense]|uniref:Tetratricopeptide repeat-containing protein n=1 Tax=Abditibacterium utsteinense TaxID=1960156 RepID=A0A2S8SR13_9BACT|nr:hypothetical protein [Abditibacterium utsteinense]PQV63251.1 hypothetical protein B1R32_11477 [Abditibacterium utsteinense]
MTSSLSLQCPVCGGQNAPDSRFCRHCGSALDGAATAPETAVGAPAENTPQISNDTPQIVAAGPSSEADSGAQTSSVSGEIDVRRAKHLLERAHNLAERGDAAGAILACRQSIVLAPMVAAGHAMLGHLLERTGDTTHAVLAYEKALHIAPDPALEDDIARLRGKMDAGPNAPIFNFDDNELFGDASDVLPSVASATAPIVAPMIPATVTAETAVPEVSTAEAMAAETDDLLPLPNIGAAAPGLPSANPRLLASGVGAASIEAATTVPALVDFSDFHVPTSRSEPKNPALVVAGQNDFSIAATSGSRLSAPPIIAPAIVPIMVDDPERKPVNWSALWSRPSYYGRSLPLVGATIVALGFLSWARGLALARATTGSSSVIVAQNDSLAASNSNDMPASDANLNSGAGAPPPLAPVGGAVTSNGGFPISNQPMNPAIAPPANPGASGVRTNSPVSAPVRPANVFGGVVPRVPSAPRRAAPRFPLSIPPAAIPPISSNLGSGNVRTNSVRPGNSGDFSLPAPNIGAPAPAAPPTSVLPSGDTTALNPAGAAGRGYVRITQGRLGSALPQRPGARAGADERAAADAARNGSTDRAIDGLTSAINSNSGDAGFRFQQRATLFLQRGDYSRAADDFQSAISAYNDQIGRGDQVASARAGLRAARSGLNLALAGGR